ncbi:MAG: T9SS type A sorting domain-containing protein, partial [Bacteroidota bacterium]
VGTDKDQFLERSMSISPNPIQTGEWFHVDLNTDIGEDITIRLYDLNGKLLEQKQPSTSNRIVWQMQEDVGVYFLKLSGEKGQIVDKIVVTE